MGSQKQYFSMNESLMHPFVYVLMRLTVPVSFISSLISSNRTVASNLKSKKIIRILNLEWPRRLESYSGRGVCEGFVVIFKVIS